VNTSEDKSISQKEKLIKVIDEDNKEYSANKTETSAGAGTAEIVQAEENKVNHNEPGDKLMDRELMKIEEIYKKHGIYSEGINSLLIVESFLKALPDHLPQNLKRESVLNIISYSGMNLGNLIADGEAKINHLNEFSMQFSMQSEKEIGEFEREIKELSKKINEIEKSINKIKNLKDEQNAIINYEIERLNNIFNFINDK
jgi:hypothetical protein